MPPDGQVNLHMLYETMGEVKVIAREAKHAAANASAKIDALAVVVATQGTMREDVEELKREVKDLVQEKHRREGAIGLLADVLRSGGCKVTELAGWKDRGRLGAFGPVKGVLCHHTAGPTTGNAPSLSTIVNGRPDLPGPLSHLHLARDGTFTVIAAGRCNHAGPGLWRGVTSGNTNFIAFRQRVSAFMGAG
jgi:hypothetical protein